MVYFTKYIETEVDVDIELEDFIEAYGTEEDLVSDLLSDMEQDKIDILFKEYSSYYSIVSDLFEAYRNNKPVDDLLRDLFNSVLGRLI